LQNLEAVLQGAGLSLKDVVKANIYLSNLSQDFGAVNEVCDRPFRSLAGSG
jgi:enamine deaminase RidA (YjgF/YER057c/UK114 family)